MTFAEASTRFLTRSLDFKGRASRSEFWWGFLLSLLLLTVATIVDIAMRHGLGFTSGGPVRTAQVTVQLMFPSVVATLEWLGKVFLLHDVRAFSIQGLVRTVILVPTLSLFVRRFHDVDRSAVWIASLDVIRLLEAPSHPGSASLVQTGLGGAPAQNGMLVDLFGLCVRIAMIVWLFRRGTEGANSYGGGRPAGRRSVANAVLPTRKSPDDEIEGFGAMPAASARSGPRTPKVFEQGQGTRPRGTGLPRRN